LNQTGLLANVSYLLSGVLTRGRIPRNESALTNGTSGWLLEPPSV